MRYARVTDGVVAEIIVLPEDVDLADAFHPEVVETIHSCGDEVQEGWTYDGGNYAAPVAPTPPLPTVEAYQRAVQSAIDEAAVSKQFNDGVTMASYVASTIKAWSDQAKAFIAWRDQVWSFVYGELAKVEAGTRTQPSVDEFLTELPVIVWPPG